MSLKLMFTHTPLYPDAEHRGILLINCPFYIFRYLDKKEKKIYYVHMHILENFIHVATI